MSEARRALAGESERDLADARLPGAEKASRGDGRNVFLEALPTEHELLHQRGLNVVSCLFERRLIIRPTHVRRVYLAFIARVSSLRYYGSAAGRSATTIEDEMSDLPNVGEPAKVSRKADAKASTARAQAQALLRRANYIFIAYTSSDLGSARQLRNRIVRMRRSASASTVFMASDASDSLPVGQAVDPPRIQAELQRADLFVLACGSLTPQSPWVMTEIQQALSQRAEGRTQILPVIMKAGVTLPQGIDFTIQAIHFSTLFPAIRRLRVAVVTALVGALAATAVFASIAIEEARERDLISLRASFGLPTWRGALPLT